ncbi:hypothetical protein [Lentibacillus daqui]|uniref:hypothetical protein n=1 Tax=Lentibacillus daqui TaxID=2911514 RepID=UPI0022B0C928|nr:hypothetical protein [Lentibacillus daqui]
MVVILLFGLAQGFLIDFIIAIAQSFSIVFFYEILLIAIVLYGISWLLLRKITIHAAR